MRSNPPPSTLIGIASCVASFLAGIAYADGFVRASSRGPGIAVFTRATGMQRIDFPTDGEHFDAVIEDPSLSIYDVVVLADGALLVAREAHDDRTRTSIVKVTRVFGKDHSDVTLPGFPMYSDAHFASNGDRVVLASAGGAFHVRGETHTLNRGGDDFAGPCYVTSQDNGRFTVLQFGSRLFRANGASVTYLGDGGDDILDAYPDSHGRALVLHRDGRVVRHGSKTAPVLVKAAGP